MLLDLQENAIFIADSHYNKNRVSFELFLDDILNEKIITTQLFLLGDMFDFLSDEIEYFKSINNTVVQKINRLSNKIEIIYLEGNHDFNLTNLFPNVKVIKRENQPLIAKYQDKKIAIGHGDIFTPFLYNIYTSIIRNSYVLSFLNLFKFILKRLEEFLIQKDICHKLFDFEEFANQRIKDYSKFDVDMIIEGHFHQGQRYKNYINIASFACDNLYSTISVQNDKISFCDNKFVI